MPDDDLGAAPSRPVSLIMFLADGVPWGDLEPRQRARILNTIRNASLLGEEPFRYGFVECRVARTGLIGLFSQERTVATVTYNEKKDRQEDFTSTFDQAWFTLDAEKGLVGLQARRFDKASGLSMELLRERFTMTIKSALRDLGYPEAELRMAPKITAVPKNEAWRLMTSKSVRVTQVTVENIHRRPLPEQYAVFNPDFDKDAFWRESVAPNTRENVESVQMKAARGGDLGKSNEARGFVAMGDTKNITAIDDQGVTTTQAEWNSRVELSEGKLASSEASVPESLSAVSDRIPDNAQVTTVSRRSGLMF